MKLLVTGCAGFIGSHTCQQLLKEGHTVIGVDRLSSTYVTAYLLENLSKIIEHERFTFYCEDIRDINFEDIFRWEKPDKVIHLAALAGVRSSIEQPQEYMRCNVEGTINVFEQCAKLDINHVVWASSSSVYGNCPNIPWKEDEELTPISPYASSKLACEDLAAVYHDLYGINFTGLRFFTVYGPSGRPDMFPYISVRNALHKREIPKFGDGSSERDYTHISDIVRGIILASNRDPDINEIINLGNSETTSLNTFLGIVQAATGVEMNIKEYPNQPGDVEKTYADTTKAKELLGWEPKVSLHEGMHEFVNWYKANRLKNERT